MEHLWRRLSDGLAYSRWADDEILGLCGHVLAEQEPQAQLFLHHLVEQQRWLARLRGEEAVGDGQRPLAEAGGLLVDLDAAWRALLLEARRGGVDPLVSYHDEHGLPCRELLSAIVVHLLFQAAHERGELIAALRAGGHGVPDLDYFVYRRHRRQEHAWSQG